MRPQQPYRFAQPSSTGCSENVRVELAGDEISQITVDKQEISLPPETLSGLLDDAKRILVLSKKVLLFADVFAVCVRDHLEKTAAPKKSEKAAETHPIAKPSLPEIPAAVAPTPATIKERHYALVFKCSTNYSSHLNLITTVKLKRSKEPTHLDHLKLEPEIDHAISVLRSQGLYPKLLSKLEKITRRINHEENIETLLSERDRLDRSADKAERYFLKYIRKLSHSQACSTASLSPASSKSSLFSSSSSQKSTAFVRFAPKTR